MTEVTAPIEGLPVGYVGDGYDWMSELTDGWVAVSGWGLDGWDLLEWPYYVLAVRASNGVFSWATYCEGDIESESFESRDELIRAVDDIAVKHWRRTSDGPTDLPAEGEDIPDKFRGPFSWERLEKSQADA